MLVFINSFICEEDVWRDDEEEEVGRDEEEGNEVSER